MIYLIGIIGTGAIIVWWYIPWNVREGLMDFTQMDDLCMFSAALLLASALWPFFWTLAGVVVLVRWRARAVKDRIV